MTAIETAVVGLAVVIMVNLLLTFGLARRLRLLQSQQASGLSLPGPGLPEIGMEIGGFETKTLDGEPLTRENFEGSRTIAAFFSPGCPPCLQVKSDMLERPPEDRVISFVQGPGRESDSLAAELSRLGLVAVFAPGDSVQKAFGDVQAFPTLIRVDHGTVVAAGIRLADLPVTTRSR